MPRQRLTEALALPIVEHSELGDICEGNSELTPEISPKPKKRSNAYNRKRVCTKPKLVMLSEADERRMQALARRWGVSGSVAIKQALREATRALGLEGGRN